MSVSFPLFTAGPHPDVVKARAVAPFHDTTCAGQTLCFNKGDIIGVSSIIHYFN